MSAGIPAPALPAWSYEIISSCEPRYSYFSNSKSFWFFISLNQMADLKWLIQANWSSAAVGDDLETILLDRLFCNTSYLHSPNRKSDGTECWPSSTAAQAEILASSSASESYSWTLSVPPIWPGSYLAWLWTTNIRLVSWYSEPDSRVLQNLQILETYFVNEVLKLSENEFSFYFN